MTGDDAASDAESCGFAPLRKRPRAAIDAAEGPRLSGDASAVDSALGEPQETRWRRQELGIEVSVENGSVPPLTESFADMPLLPDTLNTLAAMGVRRPTPIQMQAIPCILEGRDVIGLAATGSGKTLCYLLPWVARSRANASGLVHTWASVSAAIISPSALIIAPTRELTEQIFQLLRRFSGEFNASSSGLVSIGRFFTAGVVCGGIAIDSQLQELRESPQGIDVLLATPGRLLDLLHRHAVRLDAVTYLVLDEVDRMLEETMELQLREVLLATNEVNRQTLLWSATMPRFLERLANSAVLAPVTIRVGMGSHRAGQTALHVTQDVIFVRPTTKKWRLLEVLRRIPTPPVLVFCNSHEAVDAVTRLLRHEQFHVAGLHGEKAQSFRFQVVTAFREGVVDVLVSTDLASRGLDFADVHHVILYDLPHTIEDYIHRCGRTGRRPDGTRGHVTAFFTTECTIASELRQLLQRTKQSIPPELDRLDRFGADHSNS
ncbi:hypothetical protein P43SY_002087 [Pythium insidiosum]|uniref:RNA helicase n=1 Tax=Pythium insidiosum TaxID=114742 RepID=A0AAD5MHK9_PYTIN|nr:hypothetical protein P43SY_002087 [Pythium insidiosum]